MFYTISEDDLLKIKGDILELKEENESLGEEVAQWMRDYEELKAEKDRLNDELIKKSVKEARDTRFMMDVVHMIELAISPYCVVDTLTCLMNIRSDILTYLSEDEEVT